MSTIYVDADNRCHPADTGGLTAIETEFFDGMCDTVVSGYRCVVSGSGVMFAPAQPYSQLSAAQAQYELDLADRADLEASYNYLLTGVITSNE